MAALLNTGGALCSTPQSLADLVTGDNHSLHVGKSYQCQLYHYKDQLLLTNPRDVLHYSKIVKTVT